MNQRRNSEQAVIGWREWVKLSPLGIERIKAKVDTGARSSALHAYDMQEFERDGQLWVRFKVHPIQRNNRKFVESEAVILEHRTIRSSNGKSEERPVIESTVELLGIVWPVELTLTNRDEMGFRMLLGRQTIRGHFLVDSQKSFYGGTPRLNRKRKSRAEQKENQ